nr:MAG TPA: regulatory protein [Bacteriophage sp.]
MLVEITGKRYEEVLTASTRQIAEDFEKTHREVIYAIEGRTSDTERAEGLEVKNKGIIPMLIQGGNPHVENYFIGSEYVGENGRKYKEYLVTRDGFSLLAMGFTGEKALKWKLKYIEAFNAMESELKRIYTERQQWQIERDKGIIVRHILTDTIKMKVTDSPHKKVMYPNYTKLIYKTIFGKSMKELQDQYGVKGKESIREYITSDELKQIETMEMLVSSLISCGWGYDQIKVFIQENSAKMIA